MFVFKLGHDRSPLINQFACTGDIHADRPGNRPRLRGGLGLISPCFLVVMNLVAIFGWAVSAQTGSLSGRVLKFSDDSPLGNVTVVLYQGNDPQIADDDAWTHVASTSTNSDGEYRFDSRSQRRYRVQVRGQAIGGTNYFEANLFNVQVLAGSETANMDVRLRQAGLLYGFVKTPAGGPIPGIWVQAEAPWTQHGQGWTGVSTDQTGRYDLLLAPSPGEFYPIIVRNVFPGQTQ